MKTAPKADRIARGFRIRSDLVKACRLLAVQEDRKLYEVMEEAIEQYLADRQAKESAR